MNSAPFDACGANTPCARAADWRVARVGVEGVERGAQRGRVADQLDGERPRTFRIGDAQPCADLLIGGASGLERGEEKR